MITMKKNPANDIETLKDIFEIQDFNYLNITQKEQLVKIIQRWPLILELEKNKQIMEQK